MIQGSFDFFFTGAAAAADGVANGVDGATGVTTAAGGCGVVVGGATGGAGGGVLTG